MSGFDEDAKSAGPTAKATRAPVERKYPVAPHEARDTAMRRILHSDSRKPAPNPSEYNVWLEFHDFPEVLGSYRAPNPADTTRWDRNYAEHWIQTQEREDRRLYGDVRDSTAKRIEDLLLRIGGEEEPERGQTVLTLPQRIAIWQRCIDRALSEGHPETSGRIRFWRRGVERLRKRGSDADALAMVFD